MPTNAAIQIVPALDESAGLTEAERYTDALALRAAHESFSRCGARIPRADASLLLCNALFLAAKDLVERGAIDLEYLGRIELCGAAPGTLVLTFTPNDRLASEIERWTKNGAK